MSSGFVFLLVFAIITLCTAGEDAGDGDPGAFAAGELRSSTCGKGAAFNRSQGEISLLLTIRCGKVEARHRQLDVLPNIKMVVERDVLKHRGDISLARSTPGDVFAVQMNGALLRCDDSGDEIHQR